jgi:hypothetical protein
MQRSKSDPADARKVAALGTCDQPTISEALVEAELIEMANSIFPSETNCVGCCSCLHAPWAGANPKPKEVDSNLGLSTTRSITRSHSLLGLCVMMNFQTAVQKPVRAAVEIPVMSHSARCGRYEALSG